VSGLLQLSRGYKFAVLALAHPRAAVATGPFLPLSDDFALTSSLPDGALDTWLENIGRFHRDELAEESLFLWAVKPSAQTDLLDQENEDLRKEVYRLYLGLLVAVPFFSSGRLTSLTGANSDGVPRVRSLATYPRTFFTLGAATPALTIQRARLAARLGLALKEHDQVNGQGRFARALRTFREACESINLDQRLHQFVRCAEGFVAPPFKQSGVQFTKRLTRVCAGRAARQLKELYTIRGGIEHLHGPFDRLPRTLSQRERRIRLLVRCFEAEALARYLILTYLSNPRLWPHFVTRESIDAFWALKPSQFHALWPTRIHFPSILEDFDYQAVVREESET
jgi:hypothetical protein